MEQNFKIGERVQFKSWEEMKKEFGVDKYGDIRLGFIKRMRPICDTFATINSINNNQIELIDFSVGETETNWGYSTDMIKHILGKNLRGEIFEIGEKVRLESLQEVINIFGADSSEAKTASILFPSGKYVTIKNIYENNLFFHRKEQAVDLECDSLICKKMSIDMIKKIKGDNMKAKIIYNGKEAEIEVTDEMKKLFNNNTPKTNFEYGDIYYYLSDSGDVDSDRWKDSELDTNRLARRNAFRTQEDAQFKADKDLLIAEMETFAEENNDEIDWDGLYCKYYIYFDYIRNELDIRNIYANRDTFQIYFSSKEIAQKAIYKFGDRIKKYLFNIN